MIFIPCSQLTTVLGRNGSHISGVIFSISHSLLFIDAGQRPPIMSLNHSIGSSFQSAPGVLPGQYPASPLQATNNMQAHLPVANQFPAPASNQLPMINTLQPLQPIRTQNPGANNVLDMFDPLNDELLTPPIRQGINKKYVKTTQRP